MDTVFVAGWSTVFPLDTNPTDGLASDHGQEANRQGDGRTWQTDIESQGCCCPREWQEGRQATQEGETMKTALYARVSTADKGQDPEMQLRELREYCERRGWTVSAEYVDVGVSGAKDSRPQLNKLMSDAKQRRFDAVLVWKLDRLGRSLKHLVSALGEFEALGVAF